MPETAHEPPYLAAWIDAQPSTLGDDWVSRLEPRKREEAEFHDTYCAGHRNEQAGTSSNHRF